VDGRRQPARTWTPDVALSEFEQQRSLHPDINAALTPSDDISGPIIGYLKGKGVKATAFPVTGQEATLPPPASLVNGHYKDPQSKASVPSVLFRPVWVTTKNMKSTVIADKYVTVAQLCAAPYAAACKAAGITR
jgi:D-xylose transport system substrate-binding protein